jgi:hypothetical protein
MTKNFSRLLLFILLLIFALIFSGCGSAASNNTPTSEYTHYMPSEFFHFNLEFDFPSDWLLYEDKGRPAVYLDDPRFLTLPTPSPPNFHPTPNDFGSVYIWIMPSGPGQTPETELQSHKESYRNHHRYTVLNDYKITIDGYEASVLEYQEEDHIEGSQSLMFAKRIYFMVKGQVYEIIFFVAEKERGGEFEKGFDYFLNSIQILQ